jgi:hypothetical protein
MGEYRLQSKQEVVQDLRYDYQCNHHFHHFLQIDEEYSQ